jgi:putative colanic acid biosynthesis acetyltransferase WcaF
MKTTSFDVGSASGPVTIMTLPSSASVPTSPTLARDGSPAAAAAVASDEPAMDPAAASQAWIPASEWSRPGIFQRCDATAQTPYPRSWYVRRVLWELTYATLWQLGWRKAFEWRRWLLRRFGAKVHDRAWVHKRVKIMHPWIFEIGAYSTIGWDVTIYNLGPVVIGDHTVLSQDVYVCAGTHDYTRPDLPLERPRTEIGSGVWVCAKGFVGPGVKVGDNAIVGACAVVMRDVPPNVIVAGNPAKVVRARPMRPPQQQGVRDAAAAGAAGRAPTTGGGVQ